MPDRARKIVLVGFMGTGKSSVARELAVLTGLRVIELDAEVERAAGMSISEVFALHGEARFRDMEASAVLRASAEDGVIISAGGGAVLRKDNVRAMKAGGGVVVCLTASPEEILKRVAGHGHRPLLNKPDPLSEITRLRAEREPFYREAADITIQTGGKSAPDIAREIREALGWKPLR